MVLAADPPHAHTELSDAQPADAQPPYAQPSDAQPATSLTQHPFSWLQELLPCLRRVVPIWHPPLAKRNTPKRAPPTEPRGKQHLTKDIALGN